MQEYVDWLGTGVAQAGLFAMKAGAQAAEALVGVCEGCVSVRPNMEQMKENRVWWVVELMVDTGAETTADEEYVQVLLACLL